MIRSVLFFALCFFLQIMVAEVVLAAEKEDKCLDCHDSLDKPIKHAAAEEDCTYCHGPHEEKVGPPNDNPYRLTAPLNELCITCHEGMKEQHPVAGHPTSLPQDPLYPKKKFTCISCHNPHQSSMEKLIRYDYSAGNSPYKGQFCAVCHWSYAFPGDPPAPPPWQGY
jgi:predicted CXXCH cytochrome family protein